MDPVGLLEVFATVEDPRARRGVRHAFAAVLAVGACAVLAGARSFTATGRVGARLLAVTLAEDVGVTVGAADGG